MRLHQITYNSGRHQTHVHPKTRRTKKQHRTLFPTFTLGNYPKRTFWVIFCYLFLIPGKSTLEFPYWNSDFFCCFSRRSGDAYMQQWTGVSKLEALYSFSNFPVIKLEFVYRITLVLFWGIPQTFLLTSWRSMRQLLGTIPRSLGLR